MSHYSVIVVLGTDIDPSDREAVESRVEEVLAPFDEGRREVVPTVMSRKTLGRFREFYTDPTQQSRYTETPKVIPADSPLIDFLPFVEEWDGGSNPRLVTAEDKDGDYETFEYDEHRNPRGHWDWYAIGGRWLGSVSVKPGAPSMLGRPGTFGNAATGTADVCRKGDIDYEALGSVRAAEAAEAWDKASADRTVDPVIRAFFLGAEPDDTRESYIARAGAADITPYGLVNHEWHARSWWDPKYPEPESPYDGKWVNDEHWQDKTFPDLWNALSDDTVIAFVDCHS